MPLEKATIDWHSEQGDEKICSLQHARNQVDPQVLDFVHLGRYTSGELALEQELLGLFKAQALLQFDNIDRAKCKEDWVMSVHTLKGSALGIGAVQVADKAAELESVGFTGENGEKADKFTELKHAVAKCVVTIEELCKLS